MSWNAGEIDIQRYVCGYCGKGVASVSGIYCSDPPFDMYACVCPNCEKVTFIDSDGVATPGALFGRDVEKLPDKLKSLYQEARKCYSVNAFTSSVLASRKILMHIAVDKGADEGKNFRFYVDYLDEEGYIPREGKTWVDEIRSKGNMANHEIVLISKEEAEEILKFTEFLLIMNYELLKSD